MKEEDLYRRAIRVWGKGPQMLQVVDNLAELIEEAADVEIMLGQLKCCYGIERQVADYKNGKLKVIEGRLDAWEQKTK